MSWALSIRLASTGFDRSTQIPTLLKLPVSTHSPFIRLTHAPPDLPISNLHPDLALPLLSLHVCASRPVFPPFPRGLGQGELQASIEDLAFL